MNIFENDWSVGYVTEWDKDNTPIKQLMSDFEIKEEDLQDVNILYATYTYECYNGEAFVLFEKDGKLYEVNGGHCSCHGLEGQWEPEEVSIEEMKHRLTAGNFGKESQWDTELEDYVYKSVFADELLEIIGNLESK